MLDHVKDAIKSITSGIQQSLRSNPEILQLQFIYVKDNQIFAEHIIVLSQLSLSLNRDFSDKRHDYRNLNFQLLSPSPTGCY